MQTMPTQSASWTVRTANRIASPLVLPTTFLYGPVLVTSEALNLLPRSAVDDWTLKLVVADNFLFSHRVRLLLFLPEALVGTRWTISLAVVLIGSRCLMLYSEIGCCRRLVCSLWMFASGLWFLRGGQRWCATIPLVSFHFSRLLSLHVPVLLLHPCDVPP